MVGWCCIPFSLLDGRLEANAGARVLRSYYSCKRRNWQYEAASAVTAAVTPAADASYSKHGMGWDGHFAARMHDGARRRSALPHATEPVNPFHATSFEARQPVRWPKMDQSRVPFAGDAATGNEQRPLATSALGMEHWPRTSYWMLVGNCC